MTPWSSNNESQARNQPKQQTPPAAPHGETRILLQERSTSLALLYLSPLSTTSTNIPKPSAMSKRTSSSVVNGAAKDAAQPGEFAVCGRDNNCILMAAVIVDKQKVLLAEDNAHFSLIRALHLADVITELNGMYLSPGQTPTPVSYS